MEPVEKKIQEEKDNFPLLPLCEEVFLRPCAWEFIQKIHTNTWESLPRTKLQGLQEFQTTNLLVSALWTWGTI